MHTKMISLVKQSKNQRKEYHSLKRGSWNGLSPVTRIVRSKKTYDRNRVKQQYRRSSDI